MISLQKIMSLVEEYGNRQAIMGYFCDGSVSQLKVRKKANDTYQEIWNILKDLTDEVSRPTHKV